MTKKPLDKLGQYQAGLAVFAVLGIGVGFGVPAIATIALTVGGIALFALLISIPISYAASAIVEAIREHSAVD